MRAQIIDPVTVVAALVFKQLIIRAKAILNNKHGLFIALVQSVQRVSETHRVDRPAPVGDLHIGIGHGMRVAADDHRAGLLYFGLYCVGHIVTETDVVHGSLGQDLRVAFFHSGRGPFSLPLLISIGTIVASAHDVGEDISFVHSFHSLHDIFRITGIGIERNEAEHAADLEIRIDLMALLYDDRGSHHFIVGRLIERLLGILKL